MTQYDVVVIGSGPGGYVAAIRARQLGLKVAIIERDKLGGVCLNVGCIPSKALIHQAELFSSIQELEELGVRVDTTGFQYKKAFEKSRKAAETLSKGVGFLLKKNAIQVIQGHATLRSPEEVEVDGHIYTSKHILLATGSHPHELAAFQIDEKEVLSSTGALMLEKLPKSLIILGSGAIGIEFAYIMHAFGVQVFLLEGMSKILPQEDKEITNLLHTVYEKRGIQIFTNAEAYAMEKVSGGVTVKFKYQNTQKQLTGEAILSAVGRRPNIEGLGLEAVGILPEKGHIPVNANYQTQVPNIYAIGDLIPTPQLAHIASREGELAVEHIAGRNFPPLDYTLNPSCVYSEPQVASFGLTEEKLQKSNTPYKKFVFPYRGAGKSVAINRTEGLVKILVHPETQEIHSCHIIGHQATELIHEVLLAKSSELLPEDIIHMIHAHPTLSETLMEGMKGIEGRPIHV